jgi:hypothetical protein
MSRHVRSSKLLLSSAVLLLLVVPTSFAQGTDSSQQAKSLLSRSLAVLVGTGTLNDVVLQGSNPAGGSAGTFTLSGRLLEGRTDWSTRRGSLSLVLNASANSEPVGWWTDVSGQKHDLATHNCWTGQTWFSPALTITAALQQAYGAEYVGTETIRGESVDHVRFWFESGRGPQSSRDFIKKLSTVDAYLDSSTGVPAVFVFQLHPEDDASINVPIEIRFSDYRSVNGVLSPFRLQRFQNGNVMFDISVATVAINSGLSDSLFTAQ